MGRRGAVLGLGAVLKFKPYWKLFAGSLGERFHCWSFVGNGALTAARTISVDLVTTTAITADSSSIIITITARKIEGQEVGVRSIARQRLGYFPLSRVEADRIRRFLVFGQETASVLDPCAGTGAALAHVTAEAPVGRYAVELDAYRAEEATKTVDQVIHGNCFDVHSAVESFSALLLNPPYDHEISEGRNARMERLFLEHTYRWLKQTGVLVLVVPGSRLSECSDILCVHFRDKAVYRLSEPEAVRYNQIVLFGVRRTRNEREQLKDWEVQRAKAKLTALGRNYGELPVLPDHPDRQFQVPPSGPAQLIYRGLPLDTLEDLLPASVAYRQAGRILFAPEIRATGRPLTPLHGGQVGPIRNIADFSCKRLKKRLFSRWRHSIGKMFYRMRLLPPLFAPAQ